MSLATLMSTKIKPQVQAYTCQACQLSSTQTLGIKNAKRLTNLSLCNSIYKGMAMRGWLSNVVYV